MGSLRCVDGFWCVDFFLCSDKGFMIGMILNIGKVMLNLKN